MQRGDVRAGIRGWRLDAEDFQTPLGIVKIDRELAKAIRRDLVDEDAEAHPKSLDLAVWWAPLFEIPSVCLAGSEIGSVVDVADYTGSTAGMIEYAKGRKPGAKVLLVTECSMADNVAVEFPKTEFVRPCNLCPHMRRITLPRILRSLQAMEHKVEVEPAVADRARRAVERMLAVGRGAGR